MQKLANGLRISLIYNCCDAHWGNPLTIFLLSIFLVSLIVSVSIIKLSGTQMFSNDKLNFWLSVAARINLGYFSAKLAFWRLDGTL